VTVDLELPMLRTSERKSFKRCPQQWWWDWREGLVPKRRRSGALWFGTGIHLALENWYIPGQQRGVDPRETWKKFVGEQIEVIKVEMLNGDRPDGSDIEWMDAGKLGEAILTNYLKEYGHDEMWEVISPEQTFQVKIPRPGTRTAIVNYAGTFDLVARNHEDGKLYLWDHKTAKSIQVGHLPLDDQAGSYWAVATHVLRKQGLIGPRESLKGIVYNFLMKSPPDPRPQDALGRYCNKPTKKHYVDALIHEEFSDRPDNEVSTHEFEEFSVQINKMSLAKLAETAEKNGIEVLGDPSEKQPSKRFLRTTVERTASERKKQIERIGAEATVMDMYRYGELPIIKNPTKDCQWDCDFRELCQIDEDGGDTEEYISLVYNRENPYAAHQIDEED
jgi:hypothetical protein